MRTVFALPDRGQQIDSGRNAVLTRDTAEILVVNLRHRHLELARFTLQKLAADLDCPASLVLVEPVLDLVARARALDERQPVAAGLVVLLRDNLDDVAVRSLVRSGTMRPLTFAPTQV